MAAKIVGGPQKKEERRPQRRRRGEWWPPFPSTTHTTRSSYDHTSPAACTITRTGIRSTRAGLLRCSRKELLSSKIYLASPPPLSHAPPRPTTLIHHAYTTPHTHNTASHSRKNHGRRQEQQGGEGGEPLCQYHLLLHGPSRRGLCSLSQLGWVQPGLGCGRPGCAGGG